MGLTPSRYSVFSSVSQMAAMAKEKEVVEIQKRKRNDGGGTQHQAPRKRVQVGEAAPAIQRPRKRESEKVFRKVQTTARRLTIASCTSPGPITTNLLAPHSSFIWYEADTWTEVAKYLDGKSLVSLGLANRWFHHLIMQESIWRYAYLRDLQVPLPLHPPPFRWSNLYASAFDGSHSYKFRQWERHIDWMRIGAFFFDSPEAMLMETLALPRKLPEAGQDPHKSVMASGAFILTNIRTGIWIADLQLVRCPVCNLNTCEGTMQILDARSAELFLEEGYQSGSWDYEEIASHKIEKHSSTATGGIFDLKHFRSPNSLGVLDVKSWMGKADDWQPKASICLHAVAVNTNLQHNDGLHVRFDVMRSGGSDGDVVSIRISQQLI